VSILIFAVAIDGYYCIWFYGLGYGYGYMQNDKLINDPMTAPYK